MTFTIIQWLKDCEMDGAVVGGLWQAVTLLLEGYVTTDATVYQ